MPNERRFERMREVLDQRLVHVRCAAEAIYHRHNVSAVLRTCDALGIHHVHLVGERFTATRGASRGAERWLEIDRHASIEQAVRAIKDAGFALWVADLAEPPVAPEAVPVDAPLCVWLGTELEGVDAAAREAADGVITVPMRGFTQSLNVSVAAALTLHPVAERARALGPQVLMPQAQRDATWERWVARELDQDEAVAARADLRLE